MMMPTFGWFLLAAAIALLKGALVVLTVEVVRVEVEIDGQLCPRICRCVRPCICHYTAQLYLMPDSRRDSNLGFARDAREPEARCLS